MSHERSDRSHLPSHRVIRAGAEVIPPAVLSAVMANVTIRPGFLRWPDQEKELRKAAAALPDEWTIEMSAGPNGVKPPGAWELRVFGPDFDRTASFGADGVDAAMRLLKRLSPPR
jgi:hypothetical protein